MELTTKDVFHSDKHGYILRYYLPVKPLFDEMFTQKRFEELLRFCKKVKIDAVMFYVALDPNFYYMPESVEYAQSQKEQMLPYIQRLREEKISYQLNFQNLIGAQSAGTDYSDRLDWEQLVDYRGRKVSCACPLGEKFREQTARRLQIWADTQPDVIWIDDDFRLHGHGAHVLSAQDGEPAYVDYYCFCDKHISLFNKHYKVSYTREKLVEEILSEGAPMWARTAYLEFLSATMTETASWIAATVHKISPKTKIAQMTSAPNSHSAEGRTWGDFLTALSDGFAPILRPTFGPYHEFNPLDFVSSFTLLSQIQAHVRQSYKGHVYYCPEIENTRFTVWSKSASATSFQLALSAFAGCNATTLSIHDLEGGAFFDEPTYTQTLQKQKPFLDKLTTLGLDKAKEIGVKIPTDEQGAKRYVMDKNEDFATLRGGKCYIHSYLLKMGVPCTFVNVDEIDQTGVYALDAYSANILSDTALQKILRASVFLEVGAVIKLLERGYGSYIGVQSMTRQNVCVQSEVFTRKTRQDGTYIRVPSRIPLHAWYTAELDECVQIESMFVAPKGERSASLFRYENNYGGKIAVYLAKNDFGDGFYTHHRVSLFKDVFSWLNEELPRLDVPAYALFAVKETLDKKRYALVTNLSADRLTECQIDGKKVRADLNLYQTVVYVLEDTLQEIGKTKRVR